MWSRVPWTRASQILAALDGDEAETPAPAIQDPKIYFDALVASGDLERAVTYLGVALPRHEAVHWAWGILQFVARPAQDDWEARLREIIAGWIASPSDERRRATWAIATERDRRLPEKLLAGAIHFSGGSIAPDDIPAVDPPKAICGKLAGWAIIEAAQMSGSSGLLRMALMHGNRIAEGRA
jgi:hypothetical protein